MSFKGQVVWVHADDGGRPVLDAEGRAEMKYRESDTRTYRPLPQNLGSVAAGAAPVALGAPTSKPAAEPAPRKPREGKPVQPSSPSPSPSGQTVHVWTDGACSGNPGPMGIGVVVVVAGDQRKEHGEYLGRGTNNIAELTAIRRGLEIAEELLPGQKLAVRVYTDSSYAIGLLSQGWKAKANQELVADIREFLRGFPNLRMIKVEGHAGVPENERCDLLARQAVAQNRFG
jgi:ribonuclease HI